MNTGTQSTQPEATRVTDPTGDVRSVLHLPNAKHQTNSIRQSQQIHLPRLWTDTKFGSLCKDQTTTTKHRANRQTTITTQPNRHTISHRDSKRANSKSFTTINTQSTTSSQQTKDTHHITLVHTTTDQATTTNTTKGRQRTTSIQNDSDHRQRRNNLGHTRRQLWSTHDKENRTP